MNVENATHITIAACVLHNMAIMHEDNVSDFLQDLPEGDVPNPTLYFQPNTGAADKRNRIVDLIAQQRKADFHNCWLSTTHFA